MEILDLVNKLKDLTAAVKSGNITGVLDLAGDLAKLAAVIVGGFKGVDEAPADFASVDDAFGELEACGGFGAGEEMKAIDPATILTVISLVKTVLDLIKKWKS